MTNPYCVVLITASNARQADQISRMLLKERLAACVNLVPRIQSRYWWKGKIEKSSESLLIVKTRRALIMKLVAYLKKVHSYSVPEAIALPIVAGNADYLRWIRESI